MRKMTVINKNQGYEVEVIANRMREETLKEIKSMHIDELNFDHLMLDYLIKFSNEYFTVLEIDKQNKKLTLVSDNI